MRLDSEVIPIKERSAMLFLGYGRLDVEDGALVIEADRLRRVSYARENDPEACLFAQGGLPVFPFDIEL